MIWNLQRMVKIVKRKMRRAYRTSNTELGTRLEHVIQQIWGSHRALAEATGIKEGTISNYIRHGRVPAGAEMVKLAQALPGQIEYILTGIRPTALQERMVGSLPPQLRDVVTSAECLSTADHETMALLACILGQRQRNPKLVHALVEHIEGVNMAMEDGERSGDAHPPQVPTSANQRADQSE
jgi:hypothetical protein